MTQPPAGSHDLGTGGADDHPQHGNAPQAEPDTLPGGDAAATGSDADEKAGSENDGPVPIDAPPPNSAAG